MPIQSGPRNAQIMIVGDAPGVDETIQGRPFAGQSGSELTRMLMEVGINRNDCFLTNVCHVRPPGGDVDLFFHKKTEAKALGLVEHFGRYPSGDILHGLNLLRLDIRDVRPQKIIALGDTALWALTGQSAIMNWRGSALTTHPDISENPIPVLPTIHPKNVLTDWSSRFLAVQDLRRVNNSECWKKPNWKFIIRPHFDQVMDFLHLLKSFNYTKVTQIIACDIETRGGQIACIGLAIDKERAICIPIMCVERQEGYWSVEEELQIWKLLRETLTHPNIGCIFHNGAYDLQYFALQMGFVPNINHDTMIMQHVAFPGLRKSLAVCSSLYTTYHRYWKDDGKEWHKSMNEDQLWSYNCEDCVRTFEIHEVLLETLKSLNLLEQYKFQIEDLFPQVLRMMLRGVLIDMKHRAFLDKELQKLLEECQLWLDTAVGHPINPRSPLKMQQLFYEDLGLPTRKNRKTGRPTLDDEALTKIKEKYPLFRPLVEKILAMRSLGVFLSTFIRAPVPPDERMRCTYNLTGTETFRFSSSADSFGYGTNLQNIPSGDE